MLSRNNFDKLKNHGMIKYYTKEYISAKEFCFARRNLAYSPRINLFLIALYFLFSEQQKITIVSWLLMHNMLRNFRPFSNFHIKISRYSNVWAQSQYATSEYPRNGSVRSAGNLLPSYVIQRLFLGVICALLREGIPF